VDWPGVAGTYAFGRPAWDADDDNRKQEYSESGWGAWSILKSGAHGRWPVTSSSDPFPQPTLIGNTAQTPNQQNEQRSPLFGRSNPGTLVETA